MTLITGAAGKTGRALVRALAAGREPVRALIYRPEHAPGLRALGAIETPVADLRDRAPVERAVDGVRAVYHIAPNVSPDEIAIGRNVIAAAQSAGVERLVYHSVLHPHIGAMPHHWLQMHLEEKIFESGLDFTILHPCAYMQNILGSWPAIQIQGIYPVPYRTSARISMVDLTDIAEAAAKVLSETGRQGYQRHRRGRSGAEKA